MLFWGLKTYPKEYDDNWLSNPELKNTFSIQFGKDILYFWHGPGELPGNFV